MENSRKSQSKACSRGHWKPSEDEKLRELVAQYGPQNWNSIAEELEGRSGKSCRLRWYNQLDPKINKGAFSEEEEERLMALHSLFGNKWALIAKYFPGRTDNSVKNRWHVLMARNYRQKTKPCGKRSSSKSSSGLITPTLGGSHHSGPTPAAHSSSGVSKNGDMMGRKMGMIFNNYFPQVSCNEPSPSPSPSVVECTDTSHLSATTTPPFIDFLGVGAL